MKNLHQAMAQFDLDSFATLVDSVKLTVSWGMPSITAQLANTHVTKQGEFSYAANIHCGGPPF
jgi:hypothetical protein